MLTGMPTPAGGEDGAAAARRVHAEATVEFGRQYVTDVNLQVRGVRAEVEAALQQGADAALGILETADARISAALSNEEQQLARAEPAIAQLGAERSRAH
jgi:hypothetical protein